MSEKKVLQKKAIIPSEWSSLMEELQQQGVTNQQIFLVGASILYLSVVLPQKVLEIDKKVNEVLRYVDDIYSHSQRIVHFKDVLEHLEKTISNIQSIDFSVLSEYEQTVKRVLEKVKENKELFINLQQYLDDIESLVKNFQEFKKEVIQLAEVLTPLKSRLKELNDLLDLSSPSP